MFFLIKATSYGWFLDVFFEVFRHEYLQTLIKTTEQKTARGLRTSLASDSETFMGGASLITLNREVLLPDDTKALAYHSQRTVGSGHHERACAQIFNIFIL